MDRVKEKTGSNRRRPDPVHKGNSGADQYLIALFFSILARSATAGLLAVRT